MAVPLPQADVKSWFADGELARCFRCGETAVVLRQDTFSVCLDCGQVTEGSVPAAGPPGPTP